MKKLINRVTRMKRMVMNDLKLIRLFPKAKVESIIGYNRETLRKIPHWIDDEVYCNSIFQYGLPQEVKHLINKDIGDELTYTDVLCFLGSFLSKKIHYLELGVSVGKNFFKW